MTVPLHVTFKFGKDLGDESVNPDAILTSELQTRLTRLLTGKFEVDGQGRCIIMPEFPVDQVPRDSVCVAVEVGPISIGYCKEI